MTQSNIRHARLQDLEALVDIYNYYVLETAITFDIEPFTVETRRPWFDHYADSGRHQIFVAQLDDGVVGYATTSLFRPKAAYATSVETSIYIYPEHQGKGLGRALYAALFQALEKEDVHRAYAGMTLPNEASIALHERFGFKPLATYHEVGRKFDRYHDVLWMEKALD